VKIKSAAVKMGESGVTILYKYNTTFLAVFIALKPYTVAGI
jgi:hypothetical protein